MAERVGAFTPETARAIAEFVRGARRRAPRPRVDWHEVGVPQDRVIRWARTTTNYEYPTYPSSGGVYVVEMGDYEPDTLVPGDTPDKTFTPYDPAWTEVAVEPHSFPIAINTIVRCELQDGIWWIRDRPFIYKATANADITAGSYNDATIYVNGAAERTVTAWFNWMEAGTAEIASGTELLIQWFDDEAKWVVIAAECQA